MLAPNRLSDRLYHFAAILRAMLYPLSGRSCLNRIINSDSEFYQKEIGKTYPYWILASKDWQKFCTPVLIT